MKLISIVPTPNPDALKFSVDRELIAMGSRSFSSTSSAAKDVLAANIFEIEGVCGVFYMSDFVTVNKDREVSWDDVEPKIISVIEKHDPSKEQEAADPEEASEPAKKQSFGSSYETMTPAQRILFIDKILDEEIRPGLAGDGGGLEVISLDQNVLQIHYEGACGSCPSSTAGTLQFIESMLHQKVDEGLQVVPV